MEENNNNTELSGTLGSLTQNTINLMDNGVPQQNADIPQVENNDIEVLDFEPTISVSDNGIDDGASLNPVAPVPTIDPVVGPELNNNFNTELSNNFDMGNIGSVPPMDNSDKPKKKHIGLFIILIIILILAIGGGLYYYLSKGEISIVNRVKVKNPTVELGEALPKDINNYVIIKNARNAKCILNTTNVDINKLGEYNYSVTCGTKKYDGVITVADKKAPVVKTKTVAKRLNETLTASEFIAACEDATECTYEIDDKAKVDEYLKTVGTYDINLTIIDKSGNKANATAKLVVLENDVKVYLNCFLDDQSVDDINGTYSQYDKIAISSSTNYAGIYFRVKEYTITKKDEYDTIKTKYEKDKTISIGGGLDPLFDDSNLTIRFEETLTDSSEFGSTYGDIRNYYETTKGYKCNIMNAN